MPFLGATRWALLVGIVLLVACDRATPHRTVYSSLSDRVVYLPDGDSVEWQNSLTAKVPDLPDGILVEFYPFRDMTDTVELRRQARAFFPIVHRELKDRNPAFFAFRAVSLPKSKRQGIYQLAHYGFVFERRADGRWYEARAAGPPVD